MQAVVVGELWVEGGRHDAALAHEHGVILVPGEHLDGRSHRLDPRRPDEHAVERRVEAVDVEIGLEAVELAPVAVALDGDVEGAEAALVGSAVVDLGGQQDHPGARPEHRQAVGEPGLELVEQTARGEQRGHRRALAARHHERVEAGEVGGAADLWRVDAEVSERAAVGAERPLQRQTRRRRTWGLRVSPPSPAPRGGRRRSSIPMPVIGAPRPRLTLARIAGSWKCVVASTMALARGDGSSLLKMPEPTNTASAPSCMASAASAGVAMPPAQNSGTGSQPVLATSWTSGSGACRRLAQSNSSAESAWVRRADVADDRAQVAHGLDDVAGARPHPWSGSSPPPR